MALKKKLTDMLKDVRWDYWDYKIWDCNGLYLIPFGMWKNME